MPQAWRCPNAGRAGARPQAAGDSGAGVTGAGPWWARARARRGEGITAWPGPDGHSAGRAQRWERGRVTRAKRQLGEGEDARRGQGRMRRAAGTAEAEREEGRRRLTGERRERGSEARGGRRGRRRRRGGRPSREEDGASPATGSGRWRSGWRWRRGRGGSVAGEGEAAPFGGVAGIGVDPVDPTMELDGGRGDGEAATRLR